MAVSAGRFTTTVTITGASQQATSDWMHGIIDQLIVSSSTDGQSFDLIFTNSLSDEIFREEGLTINDKYKPRTDLRPRIHPRGPITVKVQNPLNVSGTVTVTFIEQKHV